MKRIDRKLIMKNRMGLHMRLAAEISGMVNRFDSEIHIIKSDSVASARSIFDLLILGVMHGDSVKLSAIGHDAKEALDAVYEFLTTYRDIEVGTHSYEACEPISFVA
jgi:phosphotransferase system HPr (HPr) family protein